MKYELIRNNRQIFCNEKEFVFQLEKESYNENFI